jgi:hypothetical protein
VKFAIWIALFQQVVIKFPAGPIDIFQEVRPEITGFKLCPDLLFERNQQ